MRCNLQQRQSIRLTCDGETAQSIHVVAMFVRDRETLADRERPRERKMHMGYRVTTSLDRIPESSAPALLTDGSACSTAQSVGATT